MRLRHMALTLALLGACAPLRAEEAKPLHPLDARLMAYRKDLVRLLRKEVERFDRLHTTGPQAVIIGRSGTLSFQRPPPLNPELPDLVGLYSLSALPAVWIEPLNDIGAKLFELGLSDGKGKTVRRPWDRYAKKLGERSMDREAIIPMKEVFPGYDPETQYPSIAIDFQQVDSLANAAHQLLDGISGAARGPFPLPEEDPRRAPLVQALEGFQSGARILGLTLRRKALGSCMARLLELQQAVFTHSVQELGRDPTPKDMKRIREVLPARWLSAIQYHHARQYFCGFNAVASSSGVGTGTGTEETEFEGKGTGGGDVAVNIDGGTGTGTPVDVLPGGGSGTGDGDAPGAGQDELAAGPGTGTGTGGGP